MATLNTNTISRQRLSLLEILIFITFVLVGVYASEKVFGWNPTLMTRPRQPQASGVRSNPAGSHRAAGGSRDQSTDGSQQPPAKSAEPQKKAPPRRSADEPPEGSSARCVTRFLRYTPSIFEAEWARNITMQLVDANKICDVVMGPDFYKWAEVYVRDSREEKLSLHDCRTHDAAVSRQTSVVARNPEVYSAMYYKRTCLDGAAGYHDHVSGIVSHDWEEDIPFTALEKLGFAEYFSAECTNEDGAGVGCEGSPLHYAFREQVVPLFNRTVVPINKTHAGSGANSPLSDLNTTAFGVPAVIRVRRTLFKTFIEPLVGLLRDPRVCGETPRVVWTPQQPAAVDPQNPFQPLGPEPPLSPMYIPPPPAIHELPPSPAQWAADHQQRQREVDQRIAEMRERIARRRAELQRMHNAMPPPSPQGYMRGFDAADAHADSDGGRSDAGDVVDSLSANDDAGEDLAKLIGALDMLLLERQQELLLASSGEGIPRDDMDSDALDTSAFQSKKHEEEVGPRRSPFHAQNIVLRKDWMLIDSLVTFPASTAPTRRFIFDLGASSWAEGGGGASQSWFYHSYRTLGVDFNEVLGPVEGTTFFRDIPDHLKPIYHYFNYGMTPKWGEWDNPLNHILQRTHRDDFVIIKIDIDSGAIEGALVDEIMANPQLYERIDELYFEHHVKMEVMEGYWRETIDQSNTYLDSLRMFSNLRKRGIRAHSWV